MNESEFKPYKNLVTGIITTAYNEAVITGRKHMDTRVKQEIKMDAIKFFFDGRLDEWLNIGCLDITPLIFKEKVASCLGIDVRNPETRLKALEKVIVRGDL